MAFRAANIMPAIEDLRAAGAVSLREIAKGLSDRGIATVRGSGSWSSVQVQRVLGAAEA